MQINKGQRVPLGEILKEDNPAFDVGININGLSGAVDFACFGLDRQQKLSDDRYMLFFNQPESPCGSVRTILADGVVAGFSFSLSSLPMTVDRLVVTAAIDGVETMKKISDGSLAISKNGSVCAKFSFSGDQFLEEKALMVGEFYRKDGKWRFSAVGQGFNGGLEALVKHFGGDVSETTAQPAEPKKIPLEKLVGEKAPKLIDLSKSAKISLEKNDLMQVKARVGLVLDASGSMMWQYKNGRVQDVVNRILPLAVHFDDDGELDTWAFSTKSLSLPSVNLGNYDNFIETAHKGWKKWGLMSSNYEPLVIKHIIEHYRDTKLPVFIVFISDGGVTRNKEISELLSKAAHLPIFWQFVGLGGRSYGVLEKLDTMAGRVVDNCGFFAIDDFNAISKEEVYNRLLNEFPSWLKDAKSKGIVK